MRKHPTRSDIVTVHNCGGPRPNACATYGWEYFAKEIAPQHTHNVIHLLSHWMRPMQFAQWSHIQKAYPDHPIANAKLFSRAMRKFDGWWAFYIGSPETLKPLEGERDRSWLSRAIDEIRPIIEARPDILFFDAFQEINEPRYQLLVERLTDKYGLMLGCEPCCYEDQGAMHDWAIAVQTEFINNRAGNNGWDTGKNAKRPLHYPGKHPLVLEFVRSSYVKQDIAAARERGFVPAVNVGRIGDAS